MFVVLSSNVTKKIKFEKVTEIVLWNPYLLFSTSASCTAVSYINMQQFKLQSHAPKKTVCVCAVCVANI